MAETKVKKAKKERVRPPIKWPGGKYRYAPLIHAESPKDHRHRVILYGGGLGEFWSWQHEGISEVVNDIDARVMNLWDVIHSPSVFPVFQQAVRTLPVARLAWERAARFDYSKLDFSGRKPCVDAAAAYFTLVRQSMSGSAQSFGPFTKTRLRNEMNEQASAWMGAVEGLIGAHTRLRRVGLECRPALEVLAREDRPGTFFYADCPYLLDDGETENNLYACSMTYTEHCEMCDAFDGAKGRIMLSGYPNGLYDAVLKAPRWRKITFATKENMSRSPKKTPRTECLWMNYHPDGTRLK